MPSPRTSSIEYCDQPRREVSELTLCVTADEANGEDNNDLDMNLQ